MSDQSVADGRLSAVVQALCNSAHLKARFGKRLACASPLPSQREMIEVFEGLRQVLLPGYFGNSEVDQESISFHVGATLDHVSRILEQQIHRGLCFACVTETSDPDCTRRADELAGAFLKKLPEIQRLLLGDIEAAYEGDPACLSPDEAIFCYPGVEAVLCQRIAHALYELKVPFLPRMLTEYAHSSTGIDIHPGARIGPCFFIDHGTGVVVGETAVLGENVRLYQGVTLGAKSFPLDDKGRPIKGIDRHPILEDDVIVYSGATILGRVTIGKGSVIGGNVWLTKDVPPGSRIMQTLPK
ncbi:MAG: serine O-acetyltransferase EpsC [Planctomycetota bacterium]